MLVPAREIDVELAPSGAYVEIRTGIVCIVVQRELRRLRRRLLDASLECNRSDVQILRGERNRALRSRDRHGIAGGKCLRFFQISRGPSQRTERERAGFG